jgi:ubiquinone/menaquinone biosynthesis C-methylase UbiE
VFFPELIKNIKLADRVLEVGPGGTPHSRSDVFLEMTHKDEETATLQRGSSKRLTTFKKIVYYDGGMFPFADGEFDYVICSHVLEHVQNIEYFLSELFRVAPKGYLEYPTIYYEYLYNFSVHLNLLKIRNKNLLYLEKSSTPLFDFYSVQKLFYQSLEKGHTKLVDDLKYIMFEGFEWLEPFGIKRATSIQELTFDDMILPCSGSPLISKRGNSISNFIRRSFFSKRKGNQ